METNLQWTSLVKEKVFQIISKNIAETMNLGGQGEGADSACRDLEPE